jgi:hypothetical protein
MVEDRVRHVLADELPDIIRHYTAGRQSQNGQAPR